MCFLGETRKRSRRVHPSPNPDKPSENKAPLGRKSSSHQTLQPVSENAEINSFLPYERRSKGLHTSFGRSLILYVHDHIRNFVSTSCSSSYNPVYNQHQPTTHPNSRRHHKQTLGHGPDKALKGNARMLSVRTFTSTQEPGTFLRCSRNPETTQRHFEWPSWVKAHVHLSFTLG